MSTPAVRHNLALLRAQMENRDWEREKFDRRLQELQAIGGHFNRALDAGVGGVVQHMSNRERLKQAMDLERFKHKSRMQLAAQKASAQGQPSAAELAKQRREALERAAPALAELVEREAGKDIVRASFAPGMGDMAKQGPGPVSPPPPPGGEDVDSIRVAAARRHLAQIPGADQLSDAEVLGLLEDSERGRAAETRKTTAEERAEESHGFKRLTEEAKDQSRRRITPEQEKQLTPLRESLVDLESVAKGYRDLSAKDRAKLASLRDLANATLQADYASVSASEGNSGGAGAGFSVSAGASKSVGGGGYNAAREAKRMLAKRLDEMVASGELSAKAKAWADTTLGKRRMQIRRMNGVGPMTDEDVADIQPSVFNPFEDQRVMMRKVNDLADRAAYQSANLLEAISEQGRRVDGRRSPLKLIAEDGEGVYAAFRFTDEDLAKLAAPANTPQQDATIRTRYSDLPNVDVGVASPAELVETAARQAVESGKQLIGDDVQRDDLAALKAAIRGMRGAGHAEKAAQLEALLRRAESGTATAEDWARIREGALSSPFRR